LLQDTNNNNKQQQQQPINIIITIIEIKVATGSSIGNRAGNMAGEEDCLVSG
jgi:hypothetical protein